MKVVLLALVSVLVLFKNIELHFVTLTINDNTTVVKFEPLFQTRQEMHLEFVFKKGQCSPFPFQD